MGLDGICSAGSGECAAQKHGANGRKAILGGRETLEIQKEEPIRSSEGIVWRGGELGCEPVTH